jgi:hypothetical protein
MLGCMKEPPVWEKAQSGCVRRMPRWERATPTAREGADGAAMERSGPLPVMEGASDAHDGEERAHAMERSGVDWEEEKCVRSQRWRVVLDGP